MLLESETIFIGSTIQQYEERKACSEDLFNWRPQIKSIDRRFAPMFCFEYEYSRRANKEVIYLWLDSNGNIQFSTTLPTDQDTGGQILAASSGQQQVKKIDITANFDNTEQTGIWTIPNPSIIWDVFLKVTTADAGETLDVGTDGAGSNDPDGFLDGVSVNATGIVKGTLASGGQTLGALLRVDESGAGVLVPEKAIISGVAALTYTGSAVTNTMRGSIYVVYTDLS